ncbi:DEAD/DEAH box helicase [[Clostridium] fimetarium]|uniref:Superfamily II DNA or RNA helicase n=1 Tax=[Clostridium] fimetarium TaxID=99656 RepID=A0A1I0RDS7_9FIRM|nr:DEAD/DEAH box helicase family protein [[Clostridium] fimetarium]SEW39024.1 Superfamily II DNA or RNA helicase [[Clostridium] fimetarium]
MKMKSKFKEIVNITGKSGSDTIKLKASQKEAIKRIDFMELSPMTRGWRGLLAMSQGVGKTNIGAIAALKLGISQNRGVIIICKKATLQGWAKTVEERAFINSTLLNRLDFKYLIISGDYMYAKAPKLSHDVDVLIVNIETMCNLMETAYYKTWYAKHENSFVIVDEVHERMNYTGVKFLNSLTDKSTVLGLSGTPESKDENRNALLLQYFHDALSIDGTQYRHQTGEYIYKYSMSKAIINKDIVNYEIEKIIMDKQKANLISTINIEALKQKGLINNGNLAEFTQALPQVSLFGDVYKNNKAKYGKTIIGLKNKNYVIAMTWVLDKLGIKYGVYISEGKEVKGFAVTYKSRENSLNAFKNPDSGVDILLTIRAAAVGIDIPIAKTLFYTHNSNSLQFVSQLFARVIRIHENKTVCHVVDFIGDFEKKVLWDINNLPNDIDPVDCSNSSTRLENEINEFDVNELNRVFVSLNCEVLSSLDITNIEVSNTLGALIYKQCRDGDCNGDIQTILVNTQLKAKLQDISNYLTDSIENSGPEVVAEGCKISVFSNDLGILSYENLLDITYYFVVHKAMPKFYSMQDITSSFDSVEKLANQLTERNMVRMQEQVIVRNFWNTNEIIATKYTDFNSFRDDYNIYVNNYLDKIKTA